MITWFSDEFAQRIHINATTDKTDKRNITYSIAVQILMLNRLC